MHMKIPGRVAIMLMLALSAQASTLDEFKVKAEAVYEFTTPPAVTRAGDEIRISFASKANCDVTIVIENAEGRVVRHLVSGVLGNNAPPPLTRNSLQQTVIWDGKDDAGVYVDDKDSQFVRVSLGLKPQFERTLFWSPHKRYASVAPLLVAAPEGVYVCEGQGIDSIKLFDHEGSYVRTVYPFPADKVGSVKGLQQQVFPQDGKPLPLKIGFQQATLLSSGSSGAPPDTEGHYGGYPATAMAVCGDRLALAYFSLNRLATDGSSGGLPIQGPKTSFEVGKRTVGPTSIAFSPDGKTLYLTGYIWKTDYWAQCGDCYHAVLRMDYEGNKEPEVFLGQLKADDGYGTDNTRFCVPSSVACDAQGRVYVSDFSNNRIQIFAPDGKHLKSIATPFPAKVIVHQKTQEIIAFSWGIIGPSNKVQTERNFNVTKIPPTMARLGTFDKPAPQAPVPMPFGYADGSGGWSETGGQVYQVAVDAWVDPFTVWAVGRKPSISVAELNWSGRSRNSLSGWELQGARVLAEDKGKWSVKRDFGVETKKAVVRADPPDFARQRLYFNPRNRQLWLGEDTGFDKSFEQALSIHPETGKIKPVEMPFDVEDLCFDSEGMVYARTDTVVMRFDPVSWREIPWDYGEERPSVRFTGSHASRSTKAIAALPIPGFRPVWWHMPGFAVNSRGELAVTCNIGSSNKKTSPKDHGRNAEDYGKPYQPTEYPGRAGGTLIQVYDKHGKLIHDDAVPGLVGADGIGIDDTGDLYALVRAPCVIDGKPYFNGMSETLMKFKPGKVKFLSSGGAPVALADSQQPKRGADITRYGIGMTWAEGVEWTYGGVAYGGQGGSCTCWHSRFVLDRLARSFVPETQRFNVAVLDSAGNLILRIGRYGNVDDGKPLVAEGGPAKPRSIGGDEVALMHCAFPAVDTDHRLFLSDGGNCRILSVKLDYHTTRRIALKDVRDSAK